MKIDAVPGITTSYRVTPTKLGSYPVVCAELCGLGHAFMRQTAHVLTDIGFTNWVSRKKMAAAAPAAGAGGAGGSAGGAGGATAAIDAKKLFAEGNGTATACGACHTLAGAGTTGTTGPNLDKFLKSDTKAQIKESIIDPQKEIAEGYAGGIMPPNYGDTLSAAEIDALVNFIYDDAHAG
jgi:cytochrome c oxidase subunit 2